MVKQLKKLLEQPVNLEKLSFGRIFILQIFLFFAIYGVMLVPRFSTDSYSVYFYASNTLDGFLTLGRVGTFLLYKLLTALKLNSVTLSPLFTAVFCAAVAWSAAMFLFLSKAYFSHSGWSTVLAAELAAILIFANIYFAELFFFSDVALVYAFDIFFMTLALYCFFRRKGRFRLILSLACLCCSLSFYQASLGMFVVLGSALVLLQYDVLWPEPEKHSAGPMLWELLRLLAVGGGAGLVNVLGMNLLRLTGYYTDRSPSLRLADILDSIRYALRQLGSYYPWGYPGYLTGILKAVFIIAGPMLLFLLADSFDRYSEKRYPMASLAATFLMLVIALVSVFMPHFLTRNVWLVPRSIYSFFAIFSFIAVIISYNHTRNGRHVPLPVLAVMLAFVCANIAGIQGIALDQIQVNQMDRREAEEIVRRIQVYEEESGMTVDTISWRVDDSLTPTYPGVRSAFMDMNIRAAARSWSLPDCISYYAGRRFQAERMPDGIWEADFQGKSWDRFAPDEQIRFKDGIMYLMTY